MPLSGSAPTTSATGTIGTAIAADATNFYFVRNGDLVKSDLSGGNLVTLVAGVSATIDAIAVEGSYLYLYKPATGIFKVSTSGGTPARFDVGASTFHAQAASWAAGNQVGATSTDLYWVEADGVHKQALAGNSDTLFATNAALTQNSNNLGAWAATTLSVVNGVIAVSGGTGGAPADFWRYDTTAGSPTWIYTAQAFNNWPTVGYGNYTAGIAFLDGYFYFNDDSGWILKVDAAGTDQTTVYKDPNQNWSQGLAACTFVSNHTVTFNANGGSGTMTNQSSATAANLTTNGLSRSGYSFTGWNTAANGTGTAYADSASYSFAADVTLYAQWAAVSSSGGSIDSTQVRIGGISTKVVDPNTPAVTVTGFNLEKVTSVQVNGVDVKFTASGSSISIALAGLAAGTSPSITISGNGFKIQLLGAFRVVEKVANSTGDNNGGTQLYSQSFSVFFAPGSSALTAAGKAALVAKLASVKAAVSGVVVTGWTQDTGNNKGDSALASNRAKAVVAWLKAKGVSVLAAIGKGTATTAAKSRRADIAYATK